MKKRIFYLTIALLMSIFLSAFIGRGPIILDPKGNNPFLKALSAELHKVGIDVIQDWRSKVKTSMKPILAPMANYPTTFIPMKEEWVYEFNQGIMGGITALKSSEPIEESEFLTRWNAAEKESRVFISFAKEDFAKAKQVKAILESKGYVAFIYLHEGTGLPDQTAFQTGEFLGSAGNHIILDTEKARKKSGVMAEVLSYVSYVHPTTVNYHVVEIYGAKERCNRTKQAIEYFKETGAKVKYFDVDKNMSAWELVNKNPQYLEKNLLPLIKVDGKFVHPRNYGVVLEKCRVLGPLKK